MTVTLALSGAQAVAAGPITLTGRMTFNAATDLPYPKARLGLTTTDTPPATYADLAHSFPAEHEDAFWDGSTEAFSGKLSGGIRYQWSDIFAYSAVKRIDSNFVVGRYVWLLAFASATPSSGDAPVAASSPYLII